MRIADYLGRGREAAIPRRQIEMMTGIDGRVIRNMIERERRSGTIILSDGTGYWISDDPAEAAQFAKSMRGRAHEIIVTARSIERAAHID